MKEPHSYHLNQALPQEDELHYRFLLESVKDYAIFMLDPEGHVATWNTGAQNIKGYTRDEILYKYFSIFYTEADREQGYPAYLLEKVRRDGKHEERGWRVRKNGERFWANISIFAMYNDEGDLIGFSKVTKDLTEQRNLEERLSHTHQELIKSEERSRLLISGVKDYAIFMVSPEGNIASWNNGAKAIKGYEADEVLGKPISIFYLPEAVEDNFPQYELRKALEAGRFEDEGWRLRKDGTQFWANVLITPIYNQEKQHIGFSKITRDLTERIRNEELMQKNQELHRVNQDLDNFIYAASHDLKAPISNIEGLLAVLQETIAPEALGDEHNKRIFDMMQESVNRFKRTISNLTDVVKLQTAKNQPAGAVNLSRVIAGIMLDMKQTIELSHATIHTEIDPDLLIHFSKSNLRSILYNLISNAIKYRSSTRSPVVRLRAIEDSGDFIIIQVQDNGLGMDLIDKNGIFKMFHRLHDHVEGTGVGLFMVKRMLENAGGRIEVQSQLGEGSVFTVYLKKVPA
jgi:PAS domain S-box-containing protein